MYWSLLILIAIFTHLQWFSLQSILTFGDWYYWPIEALRQLNYSWGTWINYISFGSNNVQIFFNFFMFTWSLLAKLGLGYNISSKITFFIPIAILSFVSPYMFSKKLIKNNFIAFVVALFYGTTTVGLVNQLPIQFVYVLTPLILYLFIQALENNNFFNWIIFVLVYWVGICYEVRIMYITTWIIIFYFLFNYGFSIKKYFKNLIISGVIIIGLNSFWLLPTVFGGITKTIEVITSRGLFGNQLFDTSHALTIFNWLWTGGKPDNSFNVQPVIWYFWLFPMLAFSVFLFFKKFNIFEKKQLLFFGFISLLGILLTKQSALPFPQLYYWLYKYFPGFSLFRESSKLFLLTAIGYLGLLSYFFLVLKQNRQKKFLFIILSLFSILASLWNMKPLVTGEIGDLFVPKYIPNDYVLVKNYVLKNKQYSRDLWIPVHSRWSIFNDSHPVLNSPDLISLNIGRDFYKNKKKFLVEGNLFINILSQKESHNLLNISSVKYVFVPLEDKANDDNFFPDYGKSRQYYINALNKISWLKKINIGTKKIAVYENLSFKPHIYTTFDKETITKDVPYKTIQYSFINPTQYSLVLDNVKKPLYVNFSESYNANWKMRVGNFDWFSVLTAKNYFLSKEWHFKNDAMLNSFYLDPKIICKINNCVKNKDGTDTINLTLYFTPQSYMYLGLIISETTLLGILGYLSFIGISSLKNKYGKKV